MTPAFKSVLRIVSQKVSIFPTKRKMAAQKKYFPAQENVNGCAGKKIGCAGKILLVVYFFDIFLLCPKNPYLCARAFNKENTILSPRSALFELLRKYHFVSPLARVLNGSGNTLPYTRLNASRHRKRRSYGTMPQPDCPNIAISVY